MSNAILEAQRAAAANPEIIRAAQETMQGLMSRSATDRSFRDQLINDPRAAVAEFTGREVPESYNVRFIENTATATIVLPDMVDPAAELSESELEAVAGGTSEPFAVVVSVVLLATAVVNAYNTYQDHQKPADQCAM